MDVLSDVLRTIRLEGALFLNADLRAPWCFKVPRGTDIAQFLQPKAQRMAIFHLVLDGECWAQIPDGEPVRLRPGDIVTIPHGDTHVLGSGLQHSAVEISNIVQPRVPELARIRYGGEGERTVLACGWFAYEGGATNNVLIENLPRLFATGLRARPAGAWIEQSVNFVLGEGAARNPGSDMLASKVAELLLAEALLGYIESLPQSHSGWLAGLRDPLVGRCLALMHAEPAKAWTIESLAQELHSSRSVLAQRFAETVGTPPMQYLAHWRMV
ncbi:MAG TPA: AraC family transcriptional regulator, partial [Ramlibacter sp.]|nr:AraC family transcriptional regulator [Ramlibacter sp.]